VSVLTKGVQIEQHFMVDIASECDHIVVDSDVVESQTSEQEVTVVKQT